MPAVKTAVFKGNDIPENVIALLNIALWLFLMYYIQIAKLTVLSKPC